MPVWKTNSTERKKLWLLVIVGFLLVFALAITLNNIPIIRFKSDMYLRWYATTKLFAEGRNLYDTRNGEEVDMIVYGHDYGLGSGYYYPAHLTLLMGPLSMLPYSTAHLIWTIAVQLFYLAGLGLLIWHVGWPRTANQIASFYILVFTFIPAMQHTIWGQFNTIGILSLSFTYLALHQQHYGRAGIYAIGLTFKPHNFALTIAFLVLWAISARSRARFWLAFTCAGALMWVIPAIFQPTWVQDFFTALGLYDQSVVTLSVIDRIWNPHQLTTIVLLLATIGISVRWRQVHVNSAPFIGCLTLTLSVWVLIVPIVGMFHVLALIPAIILLLDYYQRHRPSIYPYFVGILLIVYAIGVVGFLVGLSRADWYGLHIIWAETTYKMIFPLAITLMALPLVLPVYHRKWGFFSTMEHKQGS